LIRDCVPGCLLAGPQRGEGNSRHENFKNVVGCKAQRHVITIDIAPRKYISSLRLYLLAGTDPGGSWCDLPPKTCESNLIHHDFVQFGKQHSRYKDICRPLFCRSSAVKYTSTLLQ